MKVINKITGKDVTTKVIKLIEKSWKNEVIKVISKSPYRDENGNFIK
jgi:hypothetical protein